MTLTFVCHRFAVERKFGNVSKHGLARYLLSLSLFLSFSLSLFLFLSLRRWKGKMQINVFFPLLLLHYETSEVFVQKLIQSFNLSNSHQNYPTGFI
ncbi:MAG: hypothetical protein AUJ54_14445 [Ignavibacteria bacterium CG1_02_37_35]|nr:MAG: hypothetical protein AUJ54_14445 [Ignavibacteria bacterium CG1_02_37_35]